MGHSQNDGDVLYVEYSGGTATATTQLDKEASVLPQLTPDEELRDKKVRKKIDLLILPLCTLNYFFSSMDRGDLGNAKLSGFQADNHLSNVDFSTVLAIFYVGYIIFQPIGGLSIRWFEPYLILGLANMVWGAATILMMTSKNMLAPSILRIIIGAAEGITEINGVYLTMWYTPREYAVRAGIWYSFGVLATCFNGLIAYGIQENATSTLKPWRLLFLVEGVLPIIFGCVMIWLYPSRPEKVKKFFTEEEKELILQRTRRAYNTPGEKVTLRGSLTIFAQPQLYGMCLIYFVVIWASSGYSNFLPSIINGFGYSTVRSQLLTVPYAVLGFLSVNLFCFVSDRTQRRGVFVLGLATVALVGFAILYAVPDASGPRLFALALISLGNYPLIPIMLTWVYVNTIGLSRRAMAIPLQNVAGQVGGLAVSYTYINPPRYANGTLATLVLLATLLLVVAVLECYFFAQNKKKVTRIEEDPAWYEVNRNKAFDELGTEHPDFRYTL
ncbi:hypothetical protein UA08_01807 [Talaromyces atroroseus]|uniref:Major facilitator superfamily (MFS) profile domain-containing protein n=1 Tax=Talaromyces atroroseus TaxID=1441469 RepID=A0A1Q5QBK6_TALAT|nr:hypothetical protein UA08_01807 [Talaromyces atroroseus]OKL63314.1 hypothetical protein UA08_01807 [Talaromyces atroroseus]